MKKIRVYCWHKRRESFEHPGGHVEAEETALQAAKRVLFEETGITDCKIIPLWDYEQIWDDGIGRNNSSYFRNGNDMRNVGMCEEKCR